MKAELALLLPVPLTGRGTGYTCARIAQGMAGPALDVTIVTPRVNHHPVAPARTLQTMSPLARHLPYRWVRGTARAKLEAAFLLHLAELPPGRRAAYIWADASLPTLRALRRAKIPIFREMINGPRGAAKAILDDAYVQCGELPSHGIDAASVSEEDEALDLTDHIFCPNPMVEDALRRRGIPARKLIGASYGWDPGRFARPGRLLPPSRGLTALFVGTLSIRKGVHLLLDAWARSKLEGRLVLAGAIDPVIQRLCAPLLARDDVVLLDYVDELGPLYRSADLFVFPSLEEGGPQVTIEACGCGLPALTSPMGAGRIIRHGQDGLILDPSDTEGWIAALRRMTDHPDERRAMAASAVARAQDFVWDKVARLRGVEMVRRLG